MRRFLFHTWVGLLLFLPLAPGKTQASGEQGMLLVPEVTCLLSQEHTLRGTIQHVFSMIKRRPIAMSGLAALLCTGAALQSWAQSPTFLKEIYPGPQQFFEKIQKVNEDHPIHKLNILNAQKRDNVLKSCLEAELGKKARDPIFNEQLACYSQLKLFPYLDVAALLFTALFPHYLATNSPAHFSSLLVEFCMFFALNKDSLSIFTSDIPRLKNIIHTSFTNQLSTIDQWEEWKDTFLYWYWWICLAVLIISYFIPHSYRLCSCLMLVGPSTSNIIIEDDDYNDIRWVLLLLTHLVIAKGVPLILNRINVVNVGIFIQVILFITERLISECLFFYIVSLGRKKPSSQRKPN